MTFRQIVGDPAGLVLLIATVVVAFAVGMWVVEAATGRISRLFTRAK